MKIVQLVDHHSENMGYSDVCLSYSLSSLSHEVSVISSKFKANYNQRNYGDVYRNFHSESDKNYDYKKVNGYHLYRLNSIKSPFGLFFFGLFPLLKKLKPEIIQVGEANSFLLFQVYIYSFFLDYIITVECHIHLSVYNAAKKFNQIYKNKNIKNRIKFFIRKLKQKLFYFYISKIISTKVKRCYPISQDSEFIAINYLGYKSKQTKIMKLGTNVDLFNNDLQRNNDLKKKLGFKLHDIICIYTGRLDESKKPHLLSEAISKLNYDGFRNVRGLFIGDGTKKYKKKLENQFTKVIKFQEYKNLPKYYRISDIGIWPSQESTSQLDALACGLPLILNDEIGTPERVMDCGFLFRKDSVDDLSEKISILLNKDLRLKFSNNAAMKAKQNYSWKEIACKYIKDYVNLLEK